MPEFGVALRDALQVVTTRLAGRTDPGGRTARTTQYIVCEEAGRRGPDREGGTDRNRLAVTSSGLMGC